MKGRPLNSSENSANLASGGIERRTNLHTGESARLINEQPKNRRHSQKMREDFRILRKNKPILSPEDYIKFLDEFLKLFMSKQPMRKRIADKNMRM
jgi:hypothetical protein